MRKLLMVIDVQNDFVDGALGTSEAQEAVERIKKLIERVRDDESFYIFYTQDTHVAAYYASTLEGQKLPILHCEYGSKGWKIVEGVDISGEDCGGVAHKIKHKFGLRDDEVDAALGDEVWMLDFDEVYFCGFCTDICVMANAVNIKNGWPNIPIKIIEDCCAGSTPEKHEAALKVMNSLQMDIVRLEEV